MSHMSFHSHRPCIVPRVAVRPLLLVWLSSRFSWSPPSSLRGRRGLGKKGLYWTVGDCRTVGDCVRIRSWSLPEEGQVGGGVCQRIGWSIVYPESVVQSKDFTFWIVGPGGRVLFGMGAIVKWFKPFFLRPLLFTRSCCYAFSFAAPSQWWFGSSNMHAQRVCRSQSRWSTTFRVCVKASPDEGRQRLHSNTVYVHFFGV